MDHLSQLGISPAALLLHPKANTALVSQAKGKGWVSACSYTELGHALHQDEKLPLSDALPDLISGVWIFTSEYLLTTFEQGDAKSRLSFCRLNKNQDIGS